MAEKKERISIREELTQSKGYDIALLTTFNFEIEYFERAILNRLYACGTRKVSLFLDAKELSKAIQKTRVSGLGRRYAVNPIIMNATFHPKISLLAGKGRAKVIVSSANIKTSGYEINHEIFNVFSYDENDQRYADIILDALEFFEKLDQLSFGQDSGLIKEIRQLLRIQSVSRSNDVRLIHNLNLPILEQVISVVDKPVDSIMIVVPYYDQHLSALKEIKKEFNSSELQLYIQNQTSTFPVEINAVEQVADKIFVFEGFRDVTANASDNFYHGKVFSFQTQDGIYMLYGSANCTKSALLLAGGNGGNIECTILEKCNASSRDAFFKTIDVLDRDEKHIESRKMSYEDEWDGCFFYKYGEFADELIIHIGYTAKKQIKKVVVNGAETNYRHAQDEIIIAIESELAASIPPVFDISVLYEENEERFFGWYISRYELIHNRLSEATKNIVIRFDPDADSKRYLGDTMNLLKAYGTCAADLLEQQKTIAGIDRLKSEMNGDSVEEDDDYIVDYEIVDEYSAQYRQYHEVRRVRNELISSFCGEKYLSMPTRFEHERITKKTGGGKKESATRHPTTAEQRFYRFIKAHIKRTCESDFVERVDTRNYLGVVIVYLVIFKRYLYEEPVDLFSPEFVITARVDLLRNLLLTLNNNQQESIDDLIRPIQIGAIDAITDNWKLMLDGIEESERYRYNSLNRDLLLKLESIASVRYQLDPIIEKVCEGKNAKHIENDKRACVDYLSGLFGFMDDNLLKQYVQKIYGNSATLSIDNKVVKIQVFADNLNDYRRPNADLLKEINHYSHNVQRVSTVKIVISAKEVRTDISNPEIRIIQTIDLFYRKLQVQSVRQNGKIDIFNDKRSAF